MHAFAEAENQLLIAMLEVEAGHETPNRANLAKTAGYFRRYLVDWSDAFDSLTAGGLLTEQDGVYALTGSGRAAAEPLRQARPGMWYWYRDYYEATRTSRAYAEFCERVFGRDFSQHGFANMTQVDRLLEVLALGPGQRVLDLGCGNGGMAEYISDCTGAHVTGIDYVPEAISQAQERARGKPDRLAFRVGDMAHLDLDPGSLNALIAVDTLYFTAINDTVHQMKAILRPDGQMGIFYSQGAEPWVPYDTFPRETLHADGTTLAVALRENGLAYRAWDLTQEDYRHAQLTQRISEELRPALELEGNLFLYESRHAEADGISAAIKAGVHRRYLYHVTVGEV